MTPNSTDVIPDEDPVKEKLLQDRLSEQKQLLSKLRNALINSAEKKNDEDIEFLLKRF